VLQRVLETLKLSGTATEGAELQVRKCIEDVLIDENVVRKLAIHPERSLRMLVQQAAKTPAVLRNLGSVIFKDCLVQWFSGMLGSDLNYSGHSTWEDIGSQNPTTGAELCSENLTGALREKVDISKEDWDKLQVYNISHDSYIKVNGKYFKPAFQLASAITIADDILNTLDPELAEVLVNVLLPDSQTSDGQETLRTKGVGLAEKSLGLSISLRFWLRILPSIHKKGHEIFEKVSVHVIKQVCVQNFGHEIFLSLGTDEKICEDYLRLMFSEAVWKDLATVLAASGSRPVFALPGILDVFMKHHVQHYSVTSKTHAHQPDINDLLEEKLTQVAREYLSDQLRCQLQKCHLSNVDDAFIKMATDLLIGAVDMETVARILSDPRSLQSVFLEQMRLLSQDTSMEQKLGRTKETISLIFEHMTRSWMLERRVEEEDANGLIELFRNSGRNMVLEFSGPLQAGREILNMRDKIEDEATQTLLLRCALAILGYYLAQELTARGFDEASVALAVGVLEDVPEEKLKEFLKQPQAFVVQLMREAKEAGVAAAAQMLSEAEDMLREGLVAKLMSSGVEQACAETVAEKTENWLLNPQDALENMAEMINSEWTAEDLVQKLKEGVSKTSTVTVLSLLLFFFKDRFLPLADMVLDLQVLLQLAQRCNRESSSAGFHAFSECWFKDGDDNETETVKIFFWLVALFSVLVWVVLFLSVVGHAVAEARVRATARAQAAASDKWEQGRNVVGRTSESLFNLTLAIFQLEKREEPEGILGWCLFWVVGLMLLLSLGLPLLAAHALTVRVPGLEAFMSQTHHFIGSLTDSLLQISIDQPPQPGIFRALALLSLLLRFILLLAVGLPGAVLGLCFWSCSSLWARVTEVCTGYSRVPGSTSLSETAAQRGVSLVLIIYASPFTPVGVSVLILAEIYSVLLSPHQQLQGDFASRYENLKRVLEPVLESLMQAVIQGALVVWNAYQRGGKLDWTVLLSVVASVMQVYQVYYYIDELAQKYKTGRFSIIKELVMLGSVDKVPFRLVLLKWPAVDYSVLSSNNLDAFGPTEYFKQIGDALPGNAVLKKLRFAVRQLSFAKIEVLKPALAANQELQELRIVEDGDPKRRRLQIEELQKNKKNGDEIQKKIDRLSESISLPGRSVQQLLVSCVHLQVAHIEGISRGDYSCFFGLAFALRGVRSLKELCLAFADDVASPATAVQQQVTAGQQEDGAINRESQMTTAVRESVTELAGYFASVKTLSQLRMHRLPPDILPALMPGLTQNKSIKHLDLSGNGLDQQVLRKLAGWMRKGRLDVLVLHDIRVVKSGSMSLANALSVLDVLKAVSNPGCRLQVFDLMLAHEHEAGLGESGLQQVARSSKAAARQAKTLKFFSIGVLASQSDDTSGLHQHSSVVPGLARNLMRAVRGIHNAVLPCLSPWHDYRPETVLSRRRLEEGADAESASASVQAAYYVCTRLNRDRHKSAGRPITMLCLMLRQLPASQARDLRVLLEPVLQDSEQGTGQYSKLSSVLLLDSLGITLKDIKDWTKFISLCDEVTLQDNPIGQRGLESLRESIRSLSRPSRRFKVLYWASNQIAPQDDQANGMAQQGKRLGGIRLRILRLDMATPVPVGMGLALAGMAVDRQEGVKLADMAFDQHTSLSCSLPGGIKFDYVATPRDKGDSKLLVRRTLWSTWLAREASFVNKDDLDRAFGLLQQRQLDEFWSLVGDILKRLESHEVIDLVCIVGIVWVSRRSRVSGVGRDLYNRLLPHTLLYYITYDPC
jgi:hypothetical protein